jgi:hypothetical protein
MFFAQQLSTSRHLTMEIPFGNVEVAGGILT